MARLIEEAPARSIGTNRRSLTGQISLTHGGSVRFESSLERDWLVCLDFELSVRAIKAQPFTIVYQAHGRRCTYTPDVLAEFTSNGVTTAVVYEVKYRDDLRENWRLLKPRFKAAIRHCRTNGWRFKIVTENEIRTPALTNAQFLRKYQHREESPLIREQLLYMLPVLGETTPQALLAAAYWTTEHQMAALPVLWKLIAERKVLATLWEPLTMTSPIWLESHRV